MGALLAKVSPWVCSDSDGDGAVPGPFVWAGEAVLAAPCRSQPCSRVGVSASAALSCPLLLSLRGVLG